MMSAAQPRKRGKKPGSPKTGGRKKGVPNHLTSDLKNMILGALSDAGGQGYLHKQATLNPTAFMTLVGKVIPLTVQGTGDPTKAIVVRWEDPASQASD